MSDYLNPPLPAPEKTTPAEAGVYALLAVLADPAKCKERLDQLHAERVATEHARRESNDYRAVAEAQLDEAHEALQQISDKLDEYDKQQKDLEAREKSLAERQRHYADAIAAAKEEMVVRQAEVDDRVRTVEKRSNDLQASYKKHAAEIEQFKADRASLDRKLAKAKEFIQA